MNLLICFFAVYSHLFNPIIPKKEEGLKVCRLFADHMVLQQKDKVAIWGKALPGHSVSVDASWGKQVPTITNSDGEWKLRITTPKAGGPYQITIKCGKESIIINDVLVGEVWLASGQSNMDLPLNGWPPTDTVMNAKEAIADARSPEIRFLKVPFNISATPLDTMGGSWTPLSPQTAGNFSAAAYFYAIKLQKELHVPIGIIQSSIGGTPAEAWTSATSLKKLGDFNNQLSGLQNLQESRSAWLKKWDTSNKPNDIQGWKSLVFNDEDAKKNNFDGSKWNDIHFPGRFDQLQRGEFDGAMWVRKEFVVEDLSTDYQLHLDAVDDMDASYINGIKVGELLGNGVANAPRDDVVPKSILHQGNNLIAIRLIDTGGPGAISGKMILSNKSGIVIPLEGNWKSRLVAELVEGKFYSYGLKTDLSKRPNLFEMNSSTPTVLFNAMINPLIPYTIKGVIWYQGESNVGRAKQYGKLFPLMISDWRAHWGYPFPFYYVQVAPYNYTDPSQREQSQKLRNAQRFALKLPKTGMVTTLDIGRLSSAHPTQKKEVGDRLARFALANEYGQHLVTSGPLFKEAAADGNQLIVSFEKSSVGGGLMAKNGKLANFEVAGANKVYVEADALIKGDKIVVSSPSVKSPVYVRYAWSDGAFGSLFNEEGLPASTFTSDTNQ